MPYDWSTVQDILYNGCLHRKHILCKGFHDQFTHINFDSFFLEHIQERKEFVLEIKHKSFVTIQILEDHGPNNISFFQ